MPFERTGRVLFVAAAIAAGTPAPAHSTDSLIWLEICDASHTGRKIPLPLDRDERQSRQGCHAACSVLPGRRSVPRASA